MAQTTLETIYDALTVWYAELEGKRNVSVIFDENGMKVQMQFYDENKDQTMTTQYSISKEIMEQAYNLQDIEDSMIDQFRRHHMLWEVGEE